MAGENPRLISQKGKQVRDLGHESQPPLLFIRGNVHCADWAFTPRLIALKHDRIKDAFPIHDFLGKV